MKSPCLQIALLTAFLANSLGPIPVAQAQEFRLPAPGSMVSLSPPFNPLVLKGIKVHYDKPFRFDFILDQGDRTLSNKEITDESRKLLKYFLVGLTIPGKDLWVNLSPYEKDRIIPGSFGLTQMGRDLLAEDYVLKQITASLIYPEKQIGKKFWQRVYEEAEKKYGTTDIPVKTFNKVWIVPDKALVYENAKAGTAYVVQGRLKVMLEQDYLVLSHSVIPAEAGIQNKNDISTLGSQIIREIVIPQLTREVNENRNFAQLRQVYNSLILADWYKKKIKDSILSRVYADQNKISGLGYASGVKDNVEGIYQAYLKAFRQGVYNYVKEEISPVTQQLTPRKYFSGGIVFKSDIAYTENAADVFRQAGQRLIREEVDLAMNADNSYGEAWQDAGRGMLSYFIADIIDENGSDVLDVLERRIETYEPGDAAWAIRYLSERPDKLRYLRIFLKFVNSPERFVRLASVEAAERINDSRANEVLMAAVKDPDTRIALRALDILEKIGREEDISELLRIAKGLPEQEIFYIYDDHSSMVAYTRISEEDNVTTQHFKLKKTEIIPNFVKKRIMKVIAVIKRRSIENRRTKRIEISEVDDQVFRDFMKWLKDNHFEDVVVFGGGVRDALLGRPSADFDITIAVPLTNEEYLQFMPQKSQVNKKIIVYIHQRLEALARLFGVPVEDFFNPNKHVLWHGREVQYSGPYEKTDAEGRPVYMKRALVDSNSLSFFSSTSGPSILRMAIDMNGQLYGHVEAIDDLSQGMIRFIGNVNDVSIGTVMRVIRLQCELGLSLTFNDEEVIRHVVKDYIAKRLYERDKFLKDVVIIKQLNSIRKIVLEKRSRIDPMILLKELGVAELIQDHLKIDLDHYFDRAMVSSPGGINLDPALIDLQTYSDSNPFTVPLEQGLWLSRVQNAAGFEPVIIQIRPVKDLNAFLYGLIAN